MSWEDARAFNVLAQVAPHLRQRARAGQTNEEPFYLPAFSRPSLSIPYRKQLEFLGVNLEQDHKRPKHRFLRTIYQSA
jgi:hypothetical protein